MIEFRGVTKRYPDGTVAVDDLELQVRDGGITVFVGPSGCGKTTSLRMINRMIEPTSGTILVDGTDVMKADAARAAAGHRLRHPAGGPVPAPHDRRQHRHRAAAAGLEQEEGPRPGDGADGDRRAHARDGARATRPALRRPAAARRRGPGAGRRPAGAADGRAVQRGRPGRPREPAGRAAQAAGRAGQDDRVRHPRHRRGRQARRPGRGVPRRRQAGPVRRARRAARPARPTTSSTPSSAATAATAACRSCSSERAAAARAAHRRARRERTERGLDAWSSTPTAARWAGTTTAPAAATADADDLVPGGSLYDAGSGSLRSALDAALSSPSGQGVAVDGDGRGGRRRSPRTTCCEALAAARRAEAA